MITVSRTDAILAWHFLPVSGQLRYGKAKHAGLAVRPRQCLKYNGPLVLCQRGLHASVSALDALCYAPGPVVCRVACHGKLVKGEDKLVCSRRTCLWLADATRALYQFAINCAQSALEKERWRGREPDPRSWHALEAKRRWLAGDLTDRDLAAAWDAALDVARACAWSVARDAAMEVQNSHLESLLLTLGPAGKSESA